MNSEKHIDLRVQKTQEAIKNTFKKMVCEMDISKITIKELTDRARIHRKTFYLHYTSIEALFKHILSESSNEYFEEIDKVALPMPIEEVNRAFFTYLSKQDDFVEKLICSPNYRDYSNQLFQTNLNHNRERYNPYAKYSEEEQNIINTFLVSSSLDMYRQWIADNKRLSLEEIINLSSTLLSSGISAITKKSI